MLIQSVFLQDSPLSLLISHSLAHSLHQKQADKASFHSINHCTRSPDKPITGILIIHELLSANETQSICAPSVPTTSHSAERGTAVAFNLQLILACGSYRVLGIPCRWVAFSCVEAELIAMWNESLWGFVGLQELMYSYQNVRFSLSKGAGRIRGKCQLGC